MGEEVKRGGWEVLEEWESESDLAKSECGMESGYRV
jgi:hypothetical protein